MPINKKLYDELMVKHGAKLRAATANRDPDEAEKIRKQLPNLDVAGTTVIIIPKKKK